MSLLKQSTVATLKIGPFYEADGVTATAGLTINQADVRLSINGGNLAQKNNATACTHDEIGVYDCDLDVTDTGTLGRLNLYVHETDTRPVWHEYMVVPANVYDSIVSGSDYLQTDAVEIESVTATDQINAEVVDVMTVDTIAEMAQQAPPATPTVEEAVMYMYMSLRNLVSITATIKTFSNSAGTVIWKKVLTNTTSQHDEAEGVSGP